MEGPVYASFWPEAGIDYVGNKHRLTSLLMEEVKGHEGRQCN